MIAFQVVAAAAIMASLCIMMINDVRRTRLIVLAMI